MLRRVEIDRRAVHPYSEESTSGASTSSTYAVQRILSPNPDAVTGMSHTPELPSTHASVSRKYYLYQPIPILRLHVGKFCRDRLPQQGSLEQRGQYQPLSSITVAHSTILI